MLSPDFVQIHMLTSYPATLLNRDDVGLAKRIAFGGASRTRVSSQCLKKHWRDSPQIGELGDLAVRSRQIFQRLLMEPLQGEDGATEAEARLITEFLLSQALSSKEVGDDAAAGAEDATELKTGQVVVLTQSEVGFLRKTGQELLKALKDAKEPPKKPKDLSKFVDIDKKSLAALPAALDTALFGRFVTSDLFARVDAAASVAHAFTTHAEASETDYFTAIDTLTLDEPGAGLIQDAELTTGVFYLYVVVDMNQLRDNLVGCDEGLGTQLVRNLIQVMATVSPGAKRGSTAPYSYADFVLVERGSAQPTTLANAFLQAVCTDGAQLSQASVSALLSHREKLDKMYGSDERTEGIATIHSLPDGMDGDSLSEVVDRVLPITN